MVEGLKPYPEAGHTGQAWIGDVPDQWQVLPNRAIFTEVRYKNHPGEQRLSVTIARGVIRQSALLADSSKKDSFNRLQKCRTWRASRPAPTAPFERK